MAEESIKSSKSYLDKPQKYLLGAGTSVPQNGTKVPTPKRLTFGSYFSFTPKVKNQRLLNVPKVTTQKFHKVFQRSKL